VQISFPDSTYFFFIFAAKTAIYLSKLFDLDFVIALGGVDFEIIPTKNICLLTTCEQAHFVYPHVLSAPSVAGQPDQQCWKQSGQSCGIKPQTGQAKHL